MAIFTVTVRLVDGTVEVSRYFETLQAGRKWMRWLLTRPGFTEVSLYRGEAGGELLLRQVGRAG